MIEHEVLSHGADAAWSAQRCSIIGSLIMLSGALHSAASGRGHGTWLVHLTLRHRIEAHLLILSVLRQSLRSHRRHKIDMTVSNMVVLA